MNKKIVVVFLLSLAAIICSCSKSIPEDQGTAKNPYNVVWYSFGAQQKDLDKVLEKANEYTREKIGVTIDMRFLDDYGQQINIIEASGEPFDMCFTSDWVNHYSVSVRNGYFLELNDLLKEYAQPTIDALGQKYLDEIKIDGKVYAVPVKKEAAAQMVFTFNKKYLDKYNLDISNINSIDDLEPLLKVIKENEPSLIPLALYRNTANDNLGTLQIIEGFNKGPGAVVIEDGNYEVINKYENEDYLNNLRTIHKYYKAGYIPKDASVVDFESGGKGEDMWFCTTLLAFPYAEVLVSRNAGFEQVFAPMFEPPVRTIMGCMLAISANSERPDLVMKLINLLNTDKYLNNLLTFGIEGVQYETDENARISFLPGRKSYNIVNFAIGNTFINPLFVDEPTDKWEKFEEFNESAVVPPLLGFSFDSYPVRNEVASLNNIWLEYSAGLITGTNDPDVYVPRMIEKMESAGLDRYLAEMQKQVDVWVEERDSN